MNATSNSHVVMGAGPIGRGVAQRLAADGIAVTLASRSGRGAAIPGVTRVSIDAADSDSVVALAGAAEVIFNCLNPTYHRWPQDWPPMADALLLAAEQSGAVLVTVSNLYGYGRVTAPVTESTPLAPVGAKGAVRVAMFEQALAAHTAGRIRMVEVRAADYVGPGAQSHLGDRVVPRILAGKSRVSVLGDPDQPHTWSYTADVSAFATIVARSPHAWGRAWHVPSNPPLTQRQAIESFAAAAHLPTPRVSGVPNAALRLLGLMNPTIRELGETHHQLTRPFVMASSDSQSSFGMAPTPWKDISANTVAHFQGTLPGTAGGSRRATSAPTDIS